MPGVPAALAHAGNFLAVLHIKRHALASILHYCQHNNAVLQCQQHCRQLDIHDLHGLLHPISVSCLLAAGSQGTKLLFILILNTRPFAL